jgi:hypothetical protein
LRGASRRGGGDKGAGINKPCGNSAGKGSNDAAVLEERFDSLKFGLRHFRLTSQIVHCLWDYQIRCLLPRGCHALIVSAAHLHFGFELRFIGRQFGHFNLSEQLSFLDCVAFIHRQCFQIAGHLGVKNRFLFGQNAETGQRHTAGDFAPLGKHGLDSDGRRRFLAVRAAARKECKPERAKHKNYATIRANLHKSIQ